MRHLLIALLLTSAIVKAQETVHENYNWNKRPKYDQSVLNESESIIALKDKSVKEFMYVDDEGLFEFSIEHKAFWLNSDSKIEEYNKIYLPYSSNSDLIKSKARVIKKDGSIKELDESKILTAKDEETNQTYKYFAFEGIEKGSIVEYFYILKKYPSYQGNRIFLQSDFEKRNVSLDVYAPKNLYFEFKSYNGIEDVVQDTLEKERLHWTLIQNTVKKLEKEKEAAYNASRGFVIYKLDRNTANGSKNISSYSNLTKNIYSFLYPEPEKSDDKEMDNFLQSLSFKENNEEGKIRTLENFIKGNFYVANLRDEKYKNISSILKNKAASNLGIIRLYANLFKKLGVDSEIVCTTDRFDLFFDKDFEANNFLEEYLFYFPNIDKYMSPTENGSRIGIPPSELTDNYGLFVKEVSIGDFKSGVGKIKYINPLSASESSDNITMEVNFNESDLTKCEIDYDGSFSGYYASYVQPFLGQIKEDDLDEFYKSIIKRFDDNMNITQLNVENDKPELLGVRPFVIHTHFESDKFVEKAGKKLVFKLGELIGPQIEMYQENKRVLGVESNFNRTYNRVITVNIPDGYVIENLDQLKIFNSFVDGDQNLMEFDSKYELSGNKLKVTADEFYNKNRVSLENFEEYRKVINSAADFNKIVLVLTPEEKVGTN